MATKDIYNDLHAVAALVAVNSTGTKTSAAIDTYGFQSVIVLFDIGLSADTLSGSLLWTLSLQESDVSGSGYTAVAAGDYLGGVSSVVVALGQDSAVYKLGYKGNKRYIQGVATATGTHTSGTPIGMVAVLGHAEVLPTT